MERGIFFSIATHDTRLVVGQGPSDLVGDVEILPLAGEDEESEAGRGKLGRHQPGQVIGEAVVGH